MLQFSSRKKFKFLFKLNTKARAAEKSAIKRFGYYAILFFWEVSWLDNRWKVLLWFPLALGNLWRGVFYLKWDRSKAKMISAL